MPAIARVGDTISHDGIIIDGMIMSGASRTRVEGNLAARQGDRYFAANIIYKLLPAGHQRF